MQEAFEQPVESPWERLQGGLVLGGEAFVERVRRWMEKKPGREEVGWVSRMEDVRARRKVAEALAKRQEERCWEVWVRVVLGGERRIDVARAYGYRDGSAVTQILKRLEQSALSGPALSARMKALRAEHERGLSSVKS